jgi:hypothetical protein
MHKNRIGRPDNVPRTSGTLMERSREIVRLFDAEIKDYAFGDSGEAESYAAEMADLLEQWVEAAPKG